MGKAARWFRALLGVKKTSDSLPASGELECGPAKEKKKWGILRSFNGNVGGTGCPRGSSAQAKSSGAYVEVLDANKHAIAVAAATAAVAEAALAAAQAAAEVVRLTSSGNRASASCGDRRLELAAVKIQSAFRAYLARRALRALKGLVRLQALVRGHIVRKQSADMLRRMQAMARIQARASANRGHVSDSIYSSTKFSQSHQHPGLTTHKGNVHPLHAYSTKLDGPAVLKRCGSTSNINDIINLERKHLNSNRLENWMEERSWNIQRDTLLKIGRADDEKSDKILEVDTWKPHLSHQRNENAFQTSNSVSARNYEDPSFRALNSSSGRLTKSQKPYRSFSSGEALSSGSLKFPTEQGEEIALWTAEDSPQVHSALSRPGSSARRGPFTPTRSECSRSIFSDYTSHPNYMANTESSRAKVRSQSAPRQRIQLEKLGSTKRFVRGFWDSDTHSEREFDLRASFRTRAYPGSGRLD